MSADDEMLAALTEAVQRAGIAHAHPIREESAKGKPRPTTTIERRCLYCGASFSGLAPGKTGFRGAWSEWGWWCSVECVVSEAVDYRRLAEWYPR